MLPGPAISISQPTTFDRSLGCTGGAFEFVPTAENKHNLVVELKGPVSKFIFLYFFLTKNKFHHSKKYVFKNVVLNDSPFIFNSTSVHRAALIGTGAVSRDVSGDGSTQQAAFVYC